MFKKKNRLTKNKDFENIFKNGFSSFDKIIGVKTIKNDLGYNRFGVIVGKKVSKKAVVRNKLKRRIRSILEDYNENIKSGFDIVVITLPSSATKSYKKLRYAIIQHLLKLTLFNV